MRTIEYGTPTHVPAFLTKLWKLVTDVACDDLISWNANGTSFIIFDEIRFSKELLPMYFKHNNMASFVRQLNMYGFRKLSGIDQGGMHCYRSEIEFFHQYFLRGQEPLLELIKRKIPSSKSEEPKVNKEYIEDLISNVKSLKGKTETAEQGMKHLKRENRMLWRHVNLLAEQYSKQQVVLQQLVPFFMGMVQHSNRELALKRKATLMIDEGDLPSKMPRLLAPYYTEHSDQDQIVSMPSSPGNVSNRGPVIHDVTELESSKMFPANILCSPNTSSKESEAIVDSPLSCSLESSEQNSPYTESSTVETLNILNHNFERNNTHSPHMEMKHSPVNATSPLQQHTSQVSAMSSPQASGSSYSVSNGISPVAAIDETTSDVPISSNLITNSFVPKVEDTCTDSGMYTMDSMVNENSSMMPEKPSMLSERKPMMTENSSIMSERMSLMPEKPTIMSENSSMMCERIPLMPERTSMIPENSSMMSDRESSMMSERASAMLQERASSLMQERVSSLMQERASLMQERASSILQERAASLMQERASSIMQERAASLMQERASLMQERASLLQERPPSLIQERAPIMIQERMATAVQERAPPLMQERSPPLMQERSPPLMQERSPPLIQERSPPLMQIRSPPLMQIRSPPLMQIRSPPLMQERSPPLMQIRSPPLMQEGAPTIMQERTPTLLQERIQTMMQERASSMMQESTPVLSERLPVLPNRTAVVKSNSVSSESSSVAPNEAPSTSSQNKFLPNNFESSSKSISNSQWMLNQEPEGTEANFDNWLGQIFKSDNLVAGLSLPHEATGAFLKSD